MAVLSFRAVVKPDVMTEGTCGMCLRTLPLVIYGVTVFGDGECCIMYDDFKDAASKQLYPADFEALMETIGEENFSVADECVYLDGAKVQQDTGLMDKNSTPIFEGDIVHLACEDGGKWVGVVEWDYGAWAINFKDWKPDVRDLHASLEVVGNIVLTPDVKLDKIKKSEEK